MDKELEKAAKEINDAIYVMRKLEKKQPAVFIQDAVKNWFAEGHNEQEMRNIISWIDDAGSKKIALHQLNLLLNKQRQIDNALLTPKGHNLASGLFLGLVIGGIFGPLGYVHVNSDDGSVKSKERQSKDEGQRPFANIGVSISSLLWVLFIYLALKS